MGLRLGSAALLFLLIGAHQDTYKIEANKQPPPDSLSAAVKGALDSQGYRVLEASGKPLAEFWPRKGIPASAKPAGPKGAVLFPALADGGLLGVIRFAAEGHDYRDQSITSRCLHRPIRTPADQR